MQTIETGSAVGTGSYACDECGYVLTLTSGDQVAPCPRCGAQSFSRASMFADEQTSEGPLVGGETAPAPWLEEARAKATAPGQYLAYRYGDDTVVVPLVGEWLRIGRGLAADVRFDDPTVSRRHALIVRRADGVRVLDDRSLNGVFVNGERVDWSALKDGDEIVVGRYRLHFLEVTGTAA
jgi:DNA-directed RNA polymerase subunit RPC12/RpoP